MVDLAELGDFLVSPGVLVHELVRGEADDLEALVLVLLVQLLEASVLGRVAARASVCFPTSVASTTYPLEAVLTMSTTSPLKLDWG